MDLIYVDKDRKELGALKGYSLDLAFGVDENNFECQISDKDHCCQESFLLYVEGTEYGGSIDKIKVDTAKTEIIYKGRTWQGILESKVIEPDAGEDYLILDGDANMVLGFLIERLGLADMFKASGAVSGVSVSNYQMNRYVEGYTGIRKMLRTYGGKLHITFKNGMVELSAVPLVDYSKDEQFDTDQIEFVIEKNYTPVNHVICLGRGDLAEREIVHVYADESGNISETPVLTGLKENTAKYDYPNAESTEELRQGGIEIIQKSWNSDEVKISFNSDSSKYDIGDIVGAKERTTGIEIAAEITKKIVKISGKNITTEYKVGE